MEVCEGIKDHCVRDPDDADRHPLGIHLPPAAVRLRGAHAGADRPDRADLPPAGRDALHPPGPGDHLEGLGGRHLLRPGLPAEHLVPDHRGATGGRLLNMNVRFRSNDAYKAAFMNIFALVAAAAADRRADRRAIGRAGRAGPLLPRGRQLPHLRHRTSREFEARFLGAIEKRTFEERTMRYEDVREMMEEARPAILEKARRMGTDVKPQFHRHKAATVGRARGA